MVAEKDRAPWILKIEKQQYMVHYRHKHPHILSCCRTSWLCWYQYLRPSVQPHNSSQLKMRHLIKVCRGHILYRHAHTHTLLYQPTLPSLWTHIRIWNVRLQSVDVHLHQNSLYNMQLSCSERLKDSMDTEDRCDRGWYWYWSCSILEESDQHNWLLVEYVCEIHAWMCLWTLSPCQGAIKETLRFCWVCL